MGEKKELSGYPSIDKPWLKYYSEDAINAPLPECTIYELLWDNNKEHLNDIAIEYYGRQISYRELFANIDKAVNAFKSNGVSAGDVVIFITVTTPETIYAFYALNKLGAIPNMVDPRTSADGIREYIEEVECRLIFALDAAYSKTVEAAKGTYVDRIIVTSPSDSLPAIKKIAYRIKNKRAVLNDLSISWDKFIQNDNSDADVQNSKNIYECCVVVHTGGTTGTPKAVMLSDYALNSTVVQVKLSGFNINRGDKWLGIMPPFIAYGIANGMHLPLCTGMRLIIIPAFDPERYDKLLLKYKPTHIAGVPSHYGSVIRSNKMGRASLSDLLSPVVGGDGIEVGFERTVNSFLKKHKCTTNLIKGYGMTEICAAVTATARMEYNKLGSVGIPFTHSMVSVFDPETGEELTYNSIGEICMQGPHIMLGYYGNEEETKKVLHVHKDGTTWIHSGDLGYMDEDGCVFVHGRIKRMIIRHDGFKVYPSMIEKTIMEIPEVEKCHVVGMEDSLHAQGKLPVVYVVLKNKCDASIHHIENELRRLCKSELPEYMQPERYNFIKDLPLTNIGKVDYKELERRANE